MEDDGVVARGFEIVEVEEAAGLLRAADGGAAVSPFSAAELAYARAKTDPERRLAARLAAKRAAVLALGGEVTVADVEVRRGPYGPPALVLGERAEARLRARGADRALVSLTHERRHAAAAVLLVRGG
jgi:phosphopantetheinyl transferase (holo-ACP synthase)